MLRTENPSAGSYNEVREVNCSCKVTQYNNSYAHTEFTISPAEGYLQLDRPVTVSKMFWCPAYSYSFTSTDDKGTPYFQSLNDRWKLVNMSTAPRLGSASSLNDYSDTAIAKSATIIDG